jgi:hypothetical protein
VEQLRRIWFVEVHLATRLESCYLTNLGNRPDALTVLAIIPTVSLTMPKPERIPMFSRCQVTTAFGVGCLPLDQKTAPSTIATMTTATIARYN